MMKRVGCIHFYISVILGVAVGVFLQLSAILYSGYYGFLGILCLIGCMLNIYVSKMQKNGEDEKN